MKKFARALGLSLSALSFAATPVMAQTFTFPRGNLPTDLGSILGNALILLFFFAGVLAFVFVVIGGIQWITAGGDKMAAQAARDRITAAVVGLIIVISSFAITWIVTSIFGLNIFSESGITFPNLPNIFDTIVTPGE